MGDMRTPPVLVVQRRFDKKQAAKYAADFDENKFGFPIMNLRDGHYWTVDGQHRIAAYKMVFNDSWQTDVVDCEVYTDLSDAEMAEMFLGRDDRRRIDNYTKFHVACTAGRERESDVRRMVEANRLKVSRAKNENCVGAVTSLLKVYDGYGATVLGQVLRTIRDSFAGDAVAFDGLLIEGMGAFFNRYNGRSPERELTSKLSALQNGARGLLTKAESMRVKTGHQKIACISATLVDIFNKAKQHGRLVSWWKDVEVEATTTRPRSASAMRSESMESTT